MKVRYSDLFKVCEHYFGKPRQNGTSHAVFKTTWTGDPRVNIQKDKGKRRPIRCATYSRPSRSWRESSDGGWGAHYEQVVEEVVADLVEAGEDVPEPLPERQYSGKLNVRIPPETHRRLATEVAEQGVSLNRLVSDRLASLV